VLSIEGCKIIGDVKAGREKKNPLAQVIWMIKTAEGNIIL